MPVYLLVVITIAVPFALSRALVAGRILRVHRDALARLLLEDVRGWRKAAPVAECLRRIRPGPADEAR
jgi:hypothetical protein